MSLFIFFEKMMNLKTIILIISIQLTSSQILPYTPQIVPQMLDVPINCIDCHGCRDPFEPAEYSTTCRLIPNDPSSEINANGVQACYVW
jgi:hypothetical protein